MVPVKLETNSSITIIKNKILVSSKVTGNQFHRALSKYINKGPYDAVYLFIKSGKKQFIIQSHYLVGDIYNQNKDN